MAKPLRETIAETREQAVQAPAPALPDRPPALSTEAQVALLQEQIAAMQRQLLAMQPRVSAPAASSGQPTGAALHALAINTPRPGDRLYLVSLQGHKSRVVDPERHVPLYLDQLPIWAGSAGEAQNVFAREYHKGLHSVNPIVCDEVPGTEQQSAQAVA